MSDPNQAPLFRRLIISARARFMIETLQNLKSGKGKAVHGTAGSQAAERMKKFLSGLGKKQRGEP